MYAKFQKQFGILLIIITLSCFVSFNTENTYASISNDKIIPLFNAINATSSTEYFNETSYPRYNLVARPLDMIRYPNKGNPEIIEYYETFEIVVAGEADTDEWEFVLKNENTTLSLNILDSNYANNKWYFNVTPTMNSVGLYDLQLSCSEGNDYQTHSVKIIEQRVYPFKFLHISDSHFPSYDIYNTSDIVLNLIQDLKQLDVDFAIFTGDLIEGASATMFVDPTTGLSLAAEIQIRLGLWALDLLDMPVYIIAGNHDLDSSKPLPDDPPVIWKHYLGSYPIMTFNYLNWSFLGYSVTGTGLSETHLSDVETILDEKSKNPNVMFYHSDYLSQATNLRKSYNIEVMLYGHEHNYEQYVKKNTLYYCQDAMFHNESTVFTVLNSTAVSLHYTEYDFTPLLIYTETPTPTPTGTTTETDTAIISIMTLIPVLLLMTIFVRRKNR